MPWSAIAGTLAAALFVAAQLPMLIKAARSRDLRSYSGANLVIANCGNALQTVYILTLPWGPIWAIHLFNTATTALMLRWWWRSARATRQEQRQPARTFPDSDLTFAVAPASA